MLPILSLHSEKPILHDTEPYRSTTISARRALLSLHPTHSIVVLLLQASFRRLSWVLALPPLLFLHFEFPVPRHLLRCVFGPLKVLLLDTGAGGTVSSGDGISGCFRFLVSCGAGAGAGSGAGLGAFMRS